VCQGQLTRSYHSEHNLNSVFAEDPNINPIRPEETREIDWISHDFLPPHKYVLPAQTQSPGSVPTPDQMLQDEENDTDPASIGDEGATIENVAGMKSLSPAGESSKPLSPPQDYSDAATKKLTLSQARRVGPQPGREFPNYCPLCNVSFMARKPFTHCYPTLTSLVVWYYQFPSALYSHNRRHSEERPYTCDICYRSYKV
jgi:hypothetical protein